MRLKKKCLPSVYHMFTFFCLLFDFSLLFSDGYFIDYYSFFCFLVVFQWRYKKHKFRNKLRGKLQVELQVIGSKLGEKWEL